MKKRFLLCLSTIFLASNIVFAVSKPQWNEFCPADYLNAKPSRFNDVSNYWYNRRVQFDESMAFCTPYKGESLSSCYSKIRNDEQRKNRTAPKK